MTGSIIKYIDNCCKLSDLSYSLIIMPSKLCSLVSIIVLVMVIIANILLIFTFIMFCIVQSGFEWRSSCYEEKLDGRIFLLWNANPTFCFCEQICTPSLLHLFWHSATLLKLFSDDCKYFEVFRCIK